jgi:hypothetical protein
VGIYAAALWIGILGYGVLYAGVNKLQGNTCGLKQAFTAAGCAPAAAPTSGTGGPMPRGWTEGQLAVQRRDQFHGWLSIQPVPHG